MPIARGAGVRNGDGVTVRKKMISRELMDATCELLPFRFHLEPFKHIDISLSSVQGVFLRIVRTRYSVQT